MGYNSFAELLKNYRSSREIEQLEVTCLACGEPRFKFSILYGLSHPPNTISRFKIRSRPKCGTNILKNYSKDSR